MDKSTESGNYKINGEIISFRSKKELADFLKFKINNYQEPIEVEPLDTSITYFNHMQEIVDRGWRLVATAKGFIAMAYAIQEDGHFKNYNPDDISLCASSYSEIIQEIHDIVDAANKVYVEQWRVGKERAEATRTAASS